MCSIYSITALRGTGFFSRSKKKQVKAGVIYWKWFRRFGGSNQTFVGSTPAISEH